MFGGIRQCNSRNLAGQCRVAGRKRGKARHRASARQVLQRDFLGDALRASEALRDRRSAREMDCIGVEMHGQERVSSLDLGSLDRVRVTIPQCVSDAVVALLGVVELFLGRTRLRDERHAFE